MSTQRIPYGWIGFGLYGIGLIWIFSAIGGDEAFGFISSYLGPSLLLIFFLGQLLLISPKTRSLGRIGILLFSFVNLFFAYLWFWGSVLLGLLFLLASICSFIESAVRK